MNNKQYYSCERNHYFFGKLMTVRDFESEQIYFNSKRRLGNRTLNGAGIVAGLDVILVDSRTFSLESGMAIDYAGREIVVPEPSVKRLNVLKGFDENREQGDLYLCLAYKENYKESTFSVAGSGKDSGVSQEYNRIDEGYELFLTSKRPEETFLSLNHLVNNKVVVYDKNGIKLELEIAKHVNPGKNLKISVLFEKNNVSAPVKYSFNIGGEFFKTIEGEDTLCIEYQETEVSTYKTVRKDYYLSCDAVADAVANLQILKDSFRMEIGQDAELLNEDIQQTVTITTHSLRDIVIEDYYAKHFDDMMEEKEGQAIYLAKFHIISNQSTYFIEEFEKHPFRQYLLSNELLAVLQQMSYNGALGYSLPEKTVIPAEIQTAADAISPVENVQPDNIVTGMERIKLGYNPKVGKSYYSYEFVHGLGYGKVAVVAAVENKANYMTNEDNVLLFGDSGIFNNDEFSLSAPNAQVGALVNPDKGTMKLGIKLLEKTNAQHIDIRWWAFKPAQATSEQEEVVIDDNVKVVITPNTTKVEPLGQVRLSAVIEGSSSQEIRWSVVEDGAGTIDNNGLYTAPSKEGVYEIKAQSVKYEDKVDSAYVVVSLSE